MATTAPPLWDGRCIGTGYVSLAVLTAGGSSPGAGPVPVVAAASNGTGTCIVPAARLGGLLEDPQRCSSGLS